MTTRYVIGPSIGVARLGNSADSFYLAPDAIGALPIECDASGNVITQDGAPVRVSQFKDDAGCVRRQGALFRVFAIGDDQCAGEEITLATAGVESMEWTVHLANKKACWYNFAELEGNLLYGESNSYEARGVPLRNAGVTEPGDRQQLIIDPGPRTVSGAGQSAAFDDSSVPAGYNFASFPKPVIYGQQIKTLGNLLTDSEGRLIVLGGHGMSGGDTSISSFAGADTWHDDISDGPVTCVINFNDGSTTELTAWCIVGSPKFAPQSVNIVTLADTAWDTAVRNLDAAPDLYADGEFNPAYVANFDRDIMPILTRPGAYRWVANTPSMNSLSPPPFDARDASAASADVRAAYFRLFRQPSAEDSIGSAAADLFTPGGFPLMPLNSGSNSVSNTMTDKFLTLTLTQYFLLGQWAQGKFTTETPPPPDPATALSWGAAGNCVGGPFCPGIEVTWTTRNQNIYDAALSIRQRHPESWYYQNGLSTTEDETADTLGCEPGDMTKRMAIPWQADFFQCSIQYVNFTQPDVNKENGIPLPPTYYAYWWPPQSPWLVMTGNLNAADQQAAGTPAGQQVLFTRGINTFGQMIDYWSYMGFIVNQSTDSYADLFPYFAEQERNDGAFVAAAVAIGDASNVVSGADTNFANSWFLPQTALQTTHVSFATSRRQGRVSIRD